MFEVWPDNWPAWEVFQRCRTQWRVAPMGGLLGLDYSGVEIVIRASGEPLRILEDIQLIEQAALARLRELSDEKDTRGA